MATKQATTLSAPLENDQFAWLDAVAEPLQQIIHRLFRSSAVAHAAKDALNGTPIRHRVHPALVAVPIGAWTTSAVLDLLDAKAGTGDAPSKWSAGADAAVVFGLASVPPVAWAGIADWVDTYDHPRRVGMAHWLVNLTAIGLYGASVAARKAGNRAGGRLFGFAGLGVLMLGGALGGEMVFNLGVNVPFTLYPKPPEGFRDVLASTALAEGQHTVVEVERVPVLLVRHGGAVFAVEAWCPHAGGPLDEGMFDGCTVECPWHQSVFDLTDGHPIHGPASASLRTFAVREESGRITITPSYEGQSWPPAPKPPAAIPGK